MATTFVPVHQFEIRFVPIINLSAKIKDIVAPYIQRTSNFQIENENLSNQKITINFDGDSYAILIAWDRIVFWSNIGLDGLSEPNSLIKEPYFSIYDKIREVTSFGECKNFLFYCIGIKVIEESAFEDNVNLLNSKYLKEEACKTIFPDYKDIALTLDKNTSKTNTSISFGPYAGIKDFNNRNIQLSDKNMSMLMDVRGIFVEYKSLDEHGITPDFKIYKNLIREFKEAVDKI